MPPWIGRGSCGKRAWRSKNNKGQPGPPLATFHYRGKRLKPAADHATKNGTDGSTGTATVASGGAPDHVAEDATDDRATNRTFGIRARYRRGVVDRCRFGIRHSRRVCHGRGFGIRNRCGRIDRLHRLLHIDWSFHKDRTFNIHRPFHVHRPLHNHRRGHVHRAIHWRIIRTMRNHHRRRRVPVHGVNHRPAMHHLGGRCVKARAAAIALKAWIGVRSQRGGCQRGGSQQL